MTRMLRRLLTLPVLLLSAAGCGDSGATSAADFSALAAEASAEAHRYCQSSPPTTPAECAQTRQVHSERMHPLADRMLTRAGDMDSCMRAGGRPGSADIRASCQSLRDEMARHDGAACASSAPSSMRQERDRHCAEMDALLRRVSDRMSEMGAMTGGHMMGACQP